MSIRSKNRFLSEAVASGLCASTEDFKNQRGSADIQDI